MSTRTGRAVVIRSSGGPEVLEAVKDFSFSAPPAGELLVHVASASVNPVDTYVRSGIFGPPKNPPLILGGDVAGKVVVAPPGSKFAVGDNVFALLQNYIPIEGRQGAYAEYVAVKEEWAARVPDSLPLVDASAVPLVALTAWQALKVANAQAGQRILIYAASGGVGHFAVQFAKAFGLYVVGTAGAKNLDFVRSLGADEAVDYAGGIDDLRKRYAGNAATKFDILLDVIGGEMLELGAAELVKEGGAVSHVQNAGSNEDANKKHAQAAAAGTGPKWFTTLVQSNGEQLAEIAKLFTEGKVKVNVAHRLPLEEAAKAHQIISSKHPGGKIVLTL